MRACACLCCSYCRLQTQVHSCADKRGLVQDTVREAVDFLWALVLYHPTLLRVINTCSMEAPNEALPSCTNSRDWPAILVSPALISNLSLNLKAEQMESRNCGTTFDFSMELLARLRSHV